MHSQISSPMVNQRLVMQMLKKTSLTTQGHLRSSFRVTCKIPKRFGPAIGSHRKTLIVSGNLRGESYLLQLLVKQWGEQVFLTKARRRQPTTWSRSSLPTRNASSWISFSTTSFCNKHVLIYKRN